MRLAAVDNIGSLLVRHEYLLVVYQAFFNLGCVQILLKRLLQ